ncbi:class I SAM-dependent methyltransferase [Alkaliphilus transvaalensis]|uniref:class I SAM-dependent methyltransferase n=1 Tax=Alkaliphilus transvaalensis TaxID=114628 RepID=UPI00047C7AB5|nr:class I SAM-dependent methyltransferase [Alkaliphilus transvaalensis]
MIEKQIERYWSRRSEGYSASIQGQINSPVKGAWQELIKKYGGEDKTCKALDVGVGPGFFSILMGELGYQVTGVDVSEDMLVEAKRNMENAGVEGKFIKGEAHQVNMPNDSLDLIVSRNVVWTLTKPEETYREWYRLLKPGGKVLVFDANWYLRLSNPELQKQYIHYRQLAIEHGMVEEISPEREKESEDIGRNLPLTYRKRPDWDKEILSQLGFKEIIVEENINELIYNDIQKILYTPNPVFVVCAIK